jgi:hypothetical protein
MQGKDKFPLIPMSYYSHAKGTLLLPPPLWQAGSCSV